MKEIKIKNLDELIKKAKEFDSFRITCKNFLTKKNICYDKFTVVDHDSKVGYISESAICDYIIEQLKDTDLVVERWEDNFNKNEIDRVIKNDGDPEPVKNYFYDDYDIRVHNDKVDIKIDVKSALTAKQPTEKWNFMYPVVQANKPGKDEMILAYCVSSSLNVEKVEKIVIVGYTTEQRIKKCKIIPKGTYTRFGTKSQIDNYETELSKDYSDLDELIKFLKSMANK